jgi:hypothetical protein
MDGLQVARSVPPDVPRGARIDVSMALRAEFSPPRLKLSHGLAALLGVGTETRARVATLVWQYAKARAQCLACMAADLLSQSKRALDPSDPSIVVCDEAMAAVFGVERIQLHELLPLLDTHLRPLDPLILIYQVGATLLPSPVLTSLPQIPVYAGAVPAPSAALQQAAVQGAASGKHPISLGLDPAFYDVAVDTEDPTQEDKTAQFLASLHPETKEIAQLDDEVRLSLSVVIHTDD